MRPRAEEAQRVEVRFEITPLAELVEHALALFGVLLKRLQAFRSLRWPCHKGCVPSCGPEDFILPNLWRSGRSLAALSPPKFDLFKCPPGPQTHFQRHG